MKWIAVRSENAKAVALIRVKEVQDFLVIDGETTVMALVNGKHYAVVIDPPEPIKSFLAQLNGPVSEIPYK